MAGMPPGLAAYMASKNKGGVSPGVKQAAASRVSQVAEGLIPNVPAKKGKKFAPKKKVVSDGGY